MNERTSPPEDLMLEKGHRADESAEPMQMALGMGRSLPSEMQERLEVIQALLRSQGSDVYSRMQQEAAQRRELAFEACNDWSKRGVRKEWLD